MPATCVPWSNTNTGLSKHDGPVFLHFCILNRNLACVRTGGGWVSRPRLSCDDKERLVYSSSALLRGSGRLSDCGHSQSQGVEWLGVGVEGLRAE